MLVDSANIRYLEYSRGPRDINVLPLLGLSICILLSVGGLAFATGDDFLVSLKALSPKLRTLEIDYSTVAVGVVGLTSVITGIVWAFCRASRTFWIVMLLGFGLSEILVPLVSYVSLVVRYSSMTVLAAAAILSFSVRDVRFGAVNILALALLFWVLLRVAIGGGAQQSLMLLPIYCTILAGILLGMRGKVRSIAECAQFNSVLAALGVLFTLVHLSSFFFAAAPYEAGRFKSYYVLPTNFANAYVLMVVAMLWQAIHQVQLAKKIAFWSFVGIGGVMLVLSGTRNAVLVLGVSWVLFSTISRQRFLYRATILVVMIVAALGVAERKLQRESEVVDRLARISVANRTDVWRVAWEQIKENPYLGYGLGSTSGVLERKVETWEQATYINAHNEFLGIWLQLGIGGLFFLIAIYAITLWQGVGLLLKDIWPAEEREVLLLPVVFVVSLAIAGLFEENLSSRGSLQQVVWAISILILAQHPVIGLRGNDARYAGNVSR